MQGLGNVCKTESRDQEKVEQAQLSPKELPTEDVLMKEEVA
jgi:hypothetical protein